MKASHFSRCLKIIHACTDFLARFCTFHPQTPKQYTENPAIKSCYFHKATMFPSQTYLIYRILRGRTEFADVALNVAAANPFLWSPILLSNIIYKVKADIQRHCRDIISNQHGHHVCPLKCYSQHKWIKKTEAHSFDRPYFPSTVFQGQGCQSEIIQTNRLLPSQASSMFIKQ